jgi:hypothetical protein
MQHSVLQYNIVVLLLLSIVLRMFLLKFQIEINWKVYHYAEKHFKENLKRVNEWFFFTLSEHFISMLSCSRPTASSGYLIVLPHGINNPLVAMLLHPKRIVLLDITVVKKMNNLNAYSAHSYVYPRSRFKE